MLNSMLRSCHRYVATAEGFAGTNLCTSELCRCAIRLQTIFESSRCHLNAEQAEQAEEFEHTEVEASDVTVNHAAGVACHCLPLLECQN